MRVTVCELPNHDRDLFKSSFAELRAHVIAERSQLLLVPEMPFTAWLAQSPEVDPELWRASVAEHVLELQKLTDLSEVVFCSTRPIEIDGARYQESVAQLAGQRLAPRHCKCLLPDEPGWYEAQWYQRGPKSFEAIDSAVGRLGFLICTELWFTEHARAYGRQGVELLLSPRATDLATLDKWLACGRVASVVAGAFGLSSNFSGDSAGDHVWGGGGWIIDPDGEVLAMTSPEQPWVTLDIDLEHARRARATYPRYVEE